MRGTDHSECLQQTDNQPSNWKGSIPSSSTKEIISPLYSADFFIIVH